MKIYIKVKPKAREEKVEKTGENHYRVWITEVPEKGKANKEVVKLLAKFFSISQSKILIISGLKSANKILSVHL